VVEVRLLGPVRLSAGGRQFPAGPPQQQAMLAVLAVDAGRLVPLDTVIDGIWGQSPPARARPAVHALGTRLRRLLATVAETATATAEAETGTPGAGVAPGLRWRSGGYVLEIDSGRVDLHRFRRLAAAARRAGCPEPERAGLLEQAVARSAGVPLAGLAGEWAERMRRSWALERLDAVIDWARVASPLGRAAQLIPVLRPLLGEHPLNEPLAAALVRALAAEGRGAEALDVCLVTSEHLVAELGTGPGPDLRAVHQALLHGRPLPAPPGGADPVRPRIVPAQLPPDVAGFAGRADQLGQLDAMLAPAANPTAVVISAVSGMAGAGKTALAVHWAHRVAHRFPDGQLYVNLRGFDPGGQLMPPAEAVRGFLDALGVPADRIPTGLDAQVGLYRSLVAGRRMLVLLDNARDAAQVRPLLPGSGPPLTVVTSRDQLTPLVAAAGARPLLLDVLAAAEARELLAHRLGPARLAAEPAAVGEIVDRCARLPLALTVAASRAATNPTFPLAAIATELREARDRLDALAAGDHATDVRAVFSWSYAALAEPAARLFRLLGLHPGPDVSVPAAASLAGADPPAARRALAELVRASLLTERSPGRYAFHDLLRTYAAELTRAADPPGDRHAATGRLLDHYLHAGYAAERRIYPARDPVPPDPPGPGVTPERPADHRAALDWLGTEHRVLLASIGLASRDGFGAHVWRLAWALDTFLDRQGHWPELVDAWQPALRLADRLARAHAHRGLARAHTLLGEYPAAHRHHRAALDLSIQLGNRTAQAHSHINLAILWERQGDPEQALNHTQLALHCYRAAGHQRGQALALNGVGWCHSLLGEHRQALRYCGQALTRLQQVGDRSGEAGCWDSLGYAHHHLGRHTEAIACYRRALRLFRGVNSRHEEAATLVHLGDAEHAAGHPDRARTAWTQALRILTDLADPTTPTLQSKLNTLDPTPS